MPTTTAPMPVFSEPPIAEVVCGIAFKPLKSLLAPHLGLFWSQLRSEFPVCREVEPLVPTIESFDDEESRPMEDFSLPVLPRVWFVSKDQNGIIQIQRDRFLQNWRKVRPTDEYPRYTKVKEDFQNHINKLSAFLTENKLGTIELEQQEITYINHIYRGLGWNSLGDMGKVFPDFCWRSGGRFLSDPEMFQWRTSFLLPDKSGRMHVTVQNALRRDDGLPVLLFELTVRGIGKNKAVGDMWGWFDIAREWIVRGFADLTGNEMHSSVWHRTQ
jgi:uncharacterized protein (TIGR04255 family)